VELAGYLPRGGQPAATVKKVRKENKRAPGKEKPLEAISSDKNFQKKQIVGERAKGDPAATR